MGSFSALEDVVLQIRERATRPHLTEGLPTGIPEWDARTGGLPVGAVTIIAAPSAMGSSALAQRLVLNAVRAERGSVLLACCSDGPAVTSSRFIMATTNPPDDRLPLTLRSRLPGGDDWLSATGTVTFLDGIGHSTEEIASAARELASMQGGLRLLVIDSLQDIAGVDLRPHRGYQAIETFKEIAYELQAAVLVCAGLPPRRYGGDPRSQHPRLSELRAYGPVLPHAELVALLHRDAYFSADALNPTDAEVHAYSQTYGHFWLPLVWDRSRAALVYI